MRKTYGKQPRKNDPKVTTLHKENSVCFRMIAPKKHRIDSNFSLTAIVTPVILQSVSWSSVRKSSTFIYRFYTFQGGGLSGPKVWNFTLYSDWNLHLGKPSKKKSMDFFSTLGGEVWAKSTLFKSVEKRVSLALFACFLPFLTAKFPKISQVNILQKNVTFARDRTIFCQQNFGENFDKNINFNANLYSRWHGLEKFAKYLGIQLKIWEKTWI